MLFIFGEREDMPDKLPRITFREKRNDYIMTIPAKLSKTGKRYLTIKNAQSLINQRLQDLAHQKGEDKYFFFLW